MQIIYRHFLNKGGASEDSKLSDVHHFITTSPNFQYI